MESFRKIAQDKRKYGLLRKSCSDKIMESWLCILHSKALFPFPVKRCVAIESTGILEGSSAMKKTKIRKQLTPLYGNMY